MTRVLGPVPCISCGARVWWDRVGAQLRLMEGKRPHECRLAKNRPGAKAA